MACEEAAVGAADGAFLRPTSTAHWSGPEKQTAPWTAMETMAMMEMMMVVWSGSFQRFRFWSGSFHSEWALCCSYDAGYGENDNDNGDDDGNDDGDDGDNNQRRRQRL